MHKHQKPTIKIPPAPLFVSTVRTFARPVPALGVARRGVPVCGPHCFYNCCAPHPRPPHTHMPMPYRASGLTYRKSSDQ